MKKDTKIIAGFPGVGKSYCAENYAFINRLFIMDSDSSEFDKSNFPDNYIEHIKYHVNTGLIDIIFTSTHKVVRDALIKNNISFYLVYPNKDLKVEYLERYRQRGSDSKFIELLDKLWDTWIDEMENIDSPLVIKKVLHAGEFIDIKNL